MGRIAAQVWCLKRPEKGTELPGSGITGCSVSCLSEGWKLTLNSLQEHQAPFRPWAISPAPCLPFNEHEENGQESDMIQNVSISTCDGEAILGEHLWPPQIKTRVTLKRHHLGNYAPKLSLTSPHSTSDTPVDFSLTKGWTRNIEDSL